MQRHLLWTRLVAERHTVSPTGERIDLLEYVRRERESLVLKPNREYGGEGVVVGPTATQSEWESALDAALADETRWVIQQLASIPVKPFHVLDDSGGLHVEPVFIVMGSRPAATVLRWLRAHRSGRS